MLDFVEVRGVSWEMKVLNRQTIVLTYSSMEMGMLIITC
jgi:hypothetical protein